MHALARQPNPLGLLGAIYIIEGTGQRIIPALLPLLRKQLDLPAQAFRFLDYHGENDARHLARWLTAVEIALGARPRLAQRRRSSTSRARPPSCTCCRWSTSCERHTEVPARAARRPRPEPVARAVPGSEHAARRGLQARLAGGFSSRSRQFLLPLVRPLARATIVLFQLLKIVVPKRFTSSALLHRLLEWNMRTWLSPNANWLIFRHFHLGSEILQFIARNTRGVSMSPTPLQPTRLKEVRNHMFLQHDLNLFNFVIGLNRQLREQDLELAPIDELDFSCITRRAAADRADAGPLDATSSTCRGRSSCTRRSISCC